MEMTMVQVSVIVPMRNAEPFVAEALSSILAETEVSLEVIVIDDGSTDRSRDCVNAVCDPRVRVFDGPCRGISAGLNLALSHARGDIVMRCDADDVFPRDRIASQVRWLDANPSYGAVCGGFTTMDERGRTVAEMGVQPVPGVEDIDEELRRGVTRTSLCTYAIRRSAVARTGTFREYFETSEDIDYLLRLGEQAKVAFVSCNTYFYRLHQSSVTHSQVNARRAFFDDTARKFQVQRLEGGSDQLQLGSPPQPPSGTGSGVHSAAAHVQGMLLGQAWRLCEEGRYAQAIGFAIRAVAKQPRKWAPWRSLVVLTLRWLMPRARKSS